MKTNNNIELPNGWYVATEMESNNLFIELQKELHRDHEIKNKTIKVIAHRDGATDDILCEVIDNPGEYYVIHLTWIGREEINKDHPWIEYHGDINGFYEYENAFK